MGFNFPNSPTQGQLFTPVGGYQYVYLDGVWRVVEAPQDVGTAQSRNRIVNGAMQISQELAKNATNITTNGYVADQWHSYWVTTGVPAQGLRQDAVPTHPEVNWFFRFTATTADTSIAATEYYTAATRIEGIQLADFKWGTPSAQPAVFRLMARSVITGTFCIRITSGSATFTKNCVIATPNVWTLISFPIPPCTTGTYVDDTSLAISINITAAAGTNFNGGTDGVWMTGGALATTAQTNWLSAINQYLEFTNVGLYLDPLATGIAPPWVMPDEAEELRACQRYWQSMTVVVDTPTNSYTVSYLAQMRAAPAVTGGGTGFAVTPTDKSAAPNQTTRAAQNLVFNARM